VLCILTAVMDLSPGAAGYRVSNPPILLTATLKASLDVSHVTANSISATLFVAVVYVLRFIFVKKYFPDSTDS